MPCPESTEGKNREKKRRSQEKNDLKKATIWSPFAFSCSLHSIVISDALLMLE